MNAWTQDIADVLIITHKDVEQPARVAGYVDSLDNTTPLYVNLRVSDGLYWGYRNIKIQQSQIVRADPEWEQRQHEKQEAERKAFADRMLAKMTPAEKRRMHEDAVRLGLSAERRSPLDIMI